MLAHVGREKMDHHIAEVHDQPTLARLPFHASLLFIVFFGGFEHPFGKRVQHTVAGAVADHEIVGKRGDIFDVEKQDVFALFVLQGVDDFMGKIECVQVSPHWLFVMA